MQLAQKKDAVGVPSSSVEPMNGFLQEGHAVCARTPVEKTTMKTLANALPKTKPPMVAGKSSE
jgi:hypothetical protein